ncbi:MAG: hypothetical protein ACUVQR_10115 [Thermogutta sp.]
MANYQRHEPTWPFLVILVILFLLSATSPRAWRVVERPDPPRPKSDLEVAARLPASITPQPADRSREAEGGFGASVAGGPRAQKRREIQEATPPAGTSGETEGFAQLAVQKAIGDDSSQAQSVPTPWQDIYDLGSDLDNTVAANPREAMDLEVEDNRNTSSPGLPEMAADGSVPEQQNPGEDERRWTPPESLLALLQTLAEAKQLQVWAAHVSEQIENLGVAFDEASPQVSTILDELQRSVDSSAELQKNLEETSRLASQFRQARYALIRRLALWKAVHLAGGLDTEMGVVHAADWQRLGKTLAAVNGRLGPGATAQAWREFLNLDAISEIAQAARASDLAESDAEAKIADAVRVTLARLDRQDLTPEQRTLLGEPVFDEFLSELRFWEGQSVTGAALLGTIETFEAKGLASDGAKVMNLYYRLSRSAEERSRWVGECLNYLYRNANIRIVMTEALLNRLVPQRPGEHRPVSETILNRPVYGSSLVRTSVAVRLIPDHGRARLGLVIRGEVSSLTYSQAGLATVWNDGFGRYVAEKAIEITPLGVKAEPAVIDVENNVRLRNVSTSLDSVPVLGFLTQEVARDQVARRRLEANEEACWKLAASVLREIETETETRFQELNQRLARDVLGPLYNLNLSPTWVGADTTEDRIVVRIRLASAMQPGGHTLRPFALANSLASCQIHESAVNNFLRQLNLDGKTFTIAELETKLREKLHLPELDHSEDNPHAKAKITFAPEEAIRIEFRDGRLTVLLSVAQLISAPNRWENFQVRAVYRPEISHDHIQFVRDGVIQLVGPMDMRAQIALRGVFSKTFSRERPWQVSPGFLEKNPSLSDLTVTELTLEHGWLGFSVGTRSAAIEQTADRFLPPSQEGYGS